MSTHSFRGIQVLYLCGLAFCLAACHKAPTLESTADISGQQFEEGLRIQGHDFDSLVIENCQFSQHGLEIGDVDHLIVRNCSFRNINGNGIAIGFIGPCEGILVENCSFEDIGYNGVDSHEDALHCTVRGCDFKAIAQSQVGAAMGQPHHGIYWKGKDVLIEENTFALSDQNFGNAISVRSSGIVRKNTIVGAPRNGIMYFANHPGGDSLLIENNFLAHNKFSITVASAERPEWHNKRVIIRFNSMVQEEFHSISLGADFESTTAFEVYGNVIVNPTEKYLKDPYAFDSNSLNLTRPSDIGFVDPARGDLHLTPNAEAIGFSAGLPRFPGDDIDGDPRTASTLNAGADE